MTDRNEADSFGHSAVIVFLLFLGSAIVAGAIITMMNIGTLNPAEQTEIIQECLSHNMIPKVTTNSLGHATAINCVPKPPQKVP